jgi:hypothetical protein
MQGQLTLPRTSDAALDPAEVPRHAHSNFWCDRSAKQRTYCLAC